MDAPIYRCSIGETLSIYLEAVSGDPSTATDLIARLKPVFSAQGPMPDEAVASVATLGVVEQPTSPGNYPDGAPIGPGWYVTLTSAVTALLVAGYYATDVAFRIGSETIVTDPVLIQIVPSVSL